MIKITSSLLALVLAFSVRAASVDSLYPNLTDPSVINHAPYDSLMHGDKYETRKGKSDGSYNYCSMPHPTTSQYKEPEPVANGTVKANLTALLYIQRHQKRTAYNLFPYGENEHYDCSDAEPFLYMGASNSSQPKPLPVYAATYVDRQNPLYATLTNSTCQFPQLTVGGFLDGVQHGKELYELYGEKYHVIPSEPSKETVWLRSSTAPLTQGSAGGVLRGLWPHYNKPLPLHQQIDSIDSHEPSCDYMDTLKSASMSTKSWKKHLKVTESLRKELAHMLFTNNSDWNSDFDHYNDNFQARLCNGYKLPCDQSGSGKCVTNEQARQVFVAGDWEYNYYWVDRENVTEAIQLTSGLYIKDMLKQLQEVESGKSSLKYMHHFMHDGDIGPLAGSLGIRSLRWPGMASNIAIELWKTDKHQTYVRALYSGHTLQSRHGNMDWMPFHKFVHIWSQYVPRDFVAQCAQS
ncbi:hypothetical protein MCAP1_002820 [Malassezia caprae]|uniref:Acid phosphatase n=1 Tax=Malassezia caprae TaxID=1381934 RepID=A0AAF0IXI4_9BASI|nr:hypothetical protein MCAP1_002820 [Malassezia caprae]